MTADFALLNLKNGKVTKFNLKRGFTPLPDGLCNHLVMAHSSAGKLLYGKIRSNIE